ncbi:MAG: YitT family protein, partial [Bacteroidota bacterium]
MRIKPGKSILQRDSLRSYAFILFGSLILALGYVLFITPYRIVPGGVYGIGIVVHYLTKGVFSFAPEGFPVGLFGLILNIPLTYIGIRVLGPKFGIKTIVGFILSSFFIDGITYFYGTEPLVKDDPVLASVFGGVMIGFGLGLIFKSKATSGGSDIIAMIFAKFTKLPPGQVLIYVDSIIVLFGLVVFRDWKIPLYSWIVIYITGRVIDTTLQGVNYGKAAFIISDQYEKIREKILYDLDRGGTLLNGIGMYTNEERKVIYTNVNRRELVALQEYIKTIDPNAFMTVFNANEIIG